MNLAGKDFLTEQEAAHYSCVSLSQFKKLHQTIGIKHGNFMGKKVYRKTDLLNAMNEAWHLSSGEEKTKTQRISAGTKGKNKLKSVLARSKSMKLNK